MNTSTNTFIKGVVEALLFISEKPVMLSQIKEALKTVSVAEIRSAIQELTKEYEEQERGMQITEIAGGYQLLSNPKYAEYVRAFFKSRVKEKLTKPSLETLAIIAYKQPVTRSDVEIIRGVNSDGVVAHLLNKGLVKIVGRKDVPGRPFLHGTTKLFLEYFGLKSLEDLPKLEEFASLLPAEGKEESSEVDLHPAERQIVAKEEQAPRQEVATALESEVEGESSSATAADEKEEASE